MSSIGNYNAGTGGMDNMPLPVGSEAQTRGPSLQSFLGAVSNADVLQQSEQGQEAAKSSIVNNYNGAMNQPKLQPGTYYFSDAYNQLYADYLAGQLREHASDFETIDSNDGQTWNVDEFNRLRPDDPAFQALSKQAFDALANGDAAIDSVYRPMSELDFLEQGMNDQQKATFQWQEENDYYDHYAQDSDKKLVSMIEEQNNEREANAFILPSTPKNTANAGVQLLGGDLLPPEPAKGGGEKPVKVNQSADDLVAQGKLNSAADSDLSATKQTQDAKNVATDAGTKGGQKENIVHTPLQSKQDQNQQQGQGQGQGQNQQDEQSQEDEESTDNQVEGVQGQVAATTLSNAVETQAVNSTNQVQKNNVPSQAQAQVLQNGSTEQLVAGQQVAELVAGQQVAQLGAGQQNIQNQPLNTSQTDPLYNMNVAQAIPSAQSTQNTQTTQNTQNIQATQATIATEQNSAAAKQAMNNVLGPLQAIVNNPALSKTLNVISTNVANKTYTRLSDSVALTSSKTSATKEGKGKVSTNMLDGANSAMPDIFENLLGTDNPNTLAIAAGLPNLSLTGLLGKETASGLAMVNNMLNSISQTQAANNNAIINFGQAVGPQNQSQVVTFMTNSYNLIQNIYLEAQELFGVVSHSTDQGSYIDFLRTMSDALGKMQAYLTQMMVGNSVAARQASQGQLATTMYKLKVMYQELQKALQEQKEEANKAAGLAILNDIFGALGMVMDVVMLVLAMILTVICPLLIVFDAFIMTMMANQIMNYATGHGFIPSVMTEISNLVQDLMEQMGVDSNTAQIFGTLTDVAVVGLTCLLMVWVAGPFMLIGGMGLVTSFMAESGVINNFVSMCGGSQQDQMIVSTCIIGAIQLVTMLVTLALGVALICLPLFSAVDLIGELCAMISDALISIVDSLVTVSEASMEAVQSVLQSMIDIGQSAMEIFSDGSQIGMNSAKMAMTIKMDKLLAEIAQLQADMKQVQVVSDATIDAFKKAINILNSNMANLAQDINNVGQIITHAIKSEENVITELFS